jgi:hypothetical protein
LSLKTGRLETGATAQKKAFGQQTPRRWGWGTPLKKRTATRTKSFFLYCNSRTGLMFVNHLNRVAILRQSTQFLKPLFPAFLDFFAGF